jgi:alkanesulfonate monooxygenase SsuD/methylene tetrahydromethanopterin reductase-like flavin-dependent oxidoreductase (luciferase family)
MLDCMTEGRLIAGFVRGIPSEYLWYNVNPVESRGRFGEAFDVIMTAWTQPVWSYQGEFFQFEECAIWPRPVQQPHPPIWVAARSAESIQWCVQRRIPIAQVYQTTDQIEDTFNYYRQLSRQAGWQASPEQFILTRHIYVDETDAKARAAAEPALHYFFSLWNRGFNEAGSHARAAQPQIRAALNTEHSFAYFREGNRERVNFHPLSWDDLDKTGFMIAGSPDTVARKLKQQMRQVGAEHFMGMFHIGNLVHDKVISSLNLFHREVMPRLHDSASGGTL